MYKKYSTKELENNNLQSRWEDIISNVYYPMTVEISQTDFHAELEAWEFSDILITKLYSEGVKYIANPDKITNDTLRDYVMFTFPVNNPVIFTVDERELVSPQGTFFIEQSYSQYEVSHDQLADLLVIKIPREYIDKKIVIPQHFTAKIMNCDDAFSHTFFKFLYGLRNSYSLLKNTEKFVISGMIVDFIVLMLENNRELIESAQGAISISHLLKIESYVKENISDPELSPEKVSTNCNISTSYLYKIFSRQEQSFSNWLRNLRLDSCRIDLINPNDRASVSQVCNRWGFVDQSYFSRIFKEKYGISPLQYRKQQR